MEWINKFRRGVDCDTNPTDTPNDTVHRAVNMKMLQPGGNFAYCPLLTTEFRAQLGSEREGFLITGHFQTCAFIDDHCDDNYIKCRGIAYFIRTAFDSQLLFYCPDTKSVYTIAAGLGLTSNFVDATAYEERDCCYVIFTDGANEVRRLELKGKNVCCDVDPLKARDISLRPKFPTECIKTKVINTGALISGAYSFSIRKYNTKTCVYSDYSPFTPVCYITPYTDQNNPFGGACEEGVDKSIELSIPDLDQSEGYNSIQVLVVKYHGTKEAPSNGYLLSPSEEFWNTKTFRYAGQEEEVLVDLSDIVIDPLPVISASGNVLLENRLILLNPQIRDYEVPGLTVKHVLMEKHKISKDAPYATQDEFCNYKSEYRGEVVAYGLRLTDCYGNSVVCPVDMSKYHRDNVYIPNHGQMTFVANRPGYTTFIQTSGEELDIADLIEIQGEKGQVATKRFDASTGLFSYRITGNLSRFNGPVNYNLLYGPKGNQGSSWAWKFPCRFECPILDDDGHPIALGLKFEGIEGIPEWAVQVEVVRRNRIENIVHQTPHVPNVKVEGISKDFKFTEESPTYNGEKDTLIPKNLCSGLPVNIVGICERIRDDGAPADKVQKHHVQYELSSGPNMTPFISGFMPSYLYNKDGQPCKYDDIVGYSVEVIDAIAPTLSFRSMVPDDCAQYIESSLAGFPQQPREEDKFCIHIAHSPKCYASSNFYIWQKTEVENNELVLTKDFLIKNLDPVKIISAQPISYNSPSVLIDYQIGSWGGLQDLSQAIYESREIGGQLASMFLSKVTNTRQVLIGLECPLEDYSIKMIHDYRQDLFPFTKSKGLINVDHYTMEKYHRRAGVFPFVFPAWRSLTNKETFFHDPEDILKEGDVATVMYVLNVTKGLGDDRYGNIDDPTGDWQSTGACIEVGPKKEYSVTAFGGDVFITPHFIKVTNEGAQIAYSEDGHPDYQDGTVGQMVPSTRAFAGNILCVWLESQINGSMKEKDGTYPSVDCPQQAVIPFAPEPYQNDDFLGKWDYPYNPGYSAHKLPKVYVSKWNPCKEYNIVQGITWSNPKILNTQNNPFLDVDGYSKFEVNNVRSIDTTHGPAIHVDTLFDDYLYVFQKNKISMFPVGRRDVVLQEGSTLGVGTGTLFSDAIILPVDVGCQDPETIVKIRGRFYGVDRDRALVFSFGSRGGDFQFVHNIRFVRCFKDFIKASEGQRLRAGYIPCDENYIIYNDNGQGVAFNTAGNFWEYEVQIPGLDYLSAYEDEAFYHTGNEIHVDVEDGARGTIFGQDIEAYVDLIFNPREHKNKVIAKMKVIADCPVENVEIIPLEKNGAPVIVKLKEMMGSFIQNTIRDANGSKLCGKAYKIRIRGNRACISALYIKYRDSRRN